MLVSRKRLAGAVGLAVVVSGLLLPSAPAGANPAGTGLVINEVYGGGGNTGAPLTNDFIELYNPTASPISVNGMSLQYRSAAGSGAPGASNVFALPNKSVAPGGYFLVQAAAGTTVTDKPLPVTPDAATTGTTLALSGTGGQIFLANSATAIDPGTGTIANASVIDFVGWGTSTTSYEGAVVAPATRNSAPATTNSTSISRTSPGHDTDSNSADFAAAAAPSPTAGAVVAGPLTATSPGNKSATQDQPITGFTLSATGGTDPYHWTATGLPTGVSVAEGGAVSGTPTVSGTFNVDATVTDSASPTPATDHVLFTITVAEPAPKTIAEIQGSGARSPFAPATGNSSGSQVVTTEGVVTARYATGGLNGMYIETAGADTDGASDGIFVYAGSGNANIPADIAVGDSVRVTGPIAEYYDLTQIVPASAAAVTELGTSLGTVTPRAIAFPATDAEREAREGELLAPAGDFTVTNVYSTNQYAEVGLAAGSTPLKQWSEFASPHDLDAINAIKAENAERAVVLDDAQTINFLSSSNNNANKAIPLPWLSPANAIRVGAGVSFAGPVVLEWRNSVWKFQPTHPVTDDGADVATFEDTRADNLAPRDVLGATGDLKIATFNVLNYFNTTGEAYVASGPLQTPPIVTHCAYYNDREGNPIGNDQCGVKQPGETYTSSNPNDGRGPRGAATAASLARQEAKLAHTLNMLGADIVGLEEVENSIKLPGEANRDDALARIVELVNADAGEVRWAYVKSPGEAMTSAAIAEQDVIRSAFIYRIDKVKPVGQSDILFGTDQFANAREPLAQAFKAKGAPDSDAFALIVNHFKSKGDNASPAPKATGDNANDSVTGVGAFNGDRVRQAQRLLQFANDFAADRDIEAVFLAGDFNAYTMEDPITTLEAGGYELIDSTDLDDESYSYSGLSGSLDHVLGNDAAHAMVTGADIWEINADESPAFQYSRYNYNATDFFQANLPFATSDHNPEIVGVNVPDFTSTVYREIQVLGTNDFHGRLLPDSGNAAGAAPFATAVKELKQEVPDSIFVAAGDLVGASTFESFIQDDEPTIDALNAMGIEVSAAGNHEFDRGYLDLARRIRTRADWQYIAANLDYAASIAPADQLAETYTRTFDNGGEALKVGFVGAVTEDLPALVNPAGIEGITVTDVVDATNAAAEQLKADGADLVVLLVHEGAPTTECSAMTDPATTWGNIVENTSSDVDAIISGHTHLAYNCRFPVADWVTDGRAVTKRPVVSAGQYGTNLNQLVFKFDTTSGQLAAVSQDVIGVAGVGYAPDPTVQGIVDGAVAFADTAGSEVLGTMDGPFNRAQYVPASGATENRGGESTLGNQVAEAQRWATDTAGIDTDIAFMNPGGLRADMAGTANGDHRDLTYRQAADVQPFANTLVNMDLTGAQIETVLEQQWQRNAQGGVPSRPFLRLGASKGFTYTYVETPVTVSVPNSAPVNTFKGEVTGMWLNGTPIDPTATYSVTVNSFLGGGGDNFWELANGTHKVDTGKVDLQAMVDYMAQYDAAHPLAVDYGQRAVEVTFPASAPEVYVGGDTVTFDVASWAMSAPGDHTDTAIEVRLGGDVLGTAPVTVTPSTTAYDNVGSASVSVTLPADIRGTRATLKLVGATTGTEIPVVIPVNDGVEQVQILATNDFHGRLTRNPSGAEAGAAVLAGAVKQLRTENPETVFAAAGDLIGASTFESFIANDKPTIDALNEAGLEVSSVGNHEFDQGYSDLVDRVMAAYDATTNPEGGAHWKYIGTNVRLKSNDSHAIPASWIKDFGDVQVGFVGAVTEDLPSLVTPSGIADIYVTDIVDEANAEADALRTAGADVVVLLVHEGAATTALSAATDDSAFGRIVNGVDGDIDAIVSGHTHLAYNHAVPVQEWITEGRDVTTRPVVSAGQYGYNLNKLVFSVDTDTDEVVGVQQDILNLQTCTNCPTAGTQVWTPNYPVDAATQTIVNAAVTEADVLGAEPLGDVGGPFTRAKLADVTKENRGGESTLGNLVAEVQRWATDTPETGEAEIAFMNPGGLRSDMTGTGTGAFPRVLTYKQAAVVQPFANTLVNMDLTGANIKLALEQQWQRDGSGNVPSRPFLRLGTSSGFAYTYDPAKPEGSRITGMWLDGEPIVAGQTYSVTVNSFLASGGDNFRAFKNGTNQRDTGKVDLQAMVDYMGTHSPVAVDTAQHAVGVSFPGSAPASYLPGEHVSLSLSSLSFSSPADVKDASVTVALGDTEPVTFPVDSTVSDVPNDETGRATVDYLVPAGTPAGAHRLRVVGEQTGTRVWVPITVGTTPTDPGPTVVDTTTTATAGAMTYGTDGAVNVTVTPATASGAVTITADGVAVGSGSITNGTGTVAIGGTSLAPGSHALVVRYAGNATHKASEGGVTIQVAKASSSTSAAVTPDQVRVESGTASVSVTVAATGADPMGTVTALIGGRQVGSATLVDGKAAIAVGPFESTGTKAIEVRYSGDERVAGSAVSTSVTVVKAKATVSADHKPNVVKVGKTRARLTVRVRADGFTPGGFVTVTLPNGETLRDRLDDGRLGLTLPKFASVGTKVLTIAYEGNAKTEAASVEYEIKVVRRR